MITINPDTPTFYFNRMSLQWDIRKIMVELDSLSISLLLLKAKLVDHIQQHAPVTFHDLFPDTGNRQQFL